MTYDASRSFYRSTIHLGENIDTPHVKANSVLTNGSHDVCIILFLPASTLAPHVDRMPGWALEGKLWKYTGHQPRLIWQCLVSTETKAMKGFRQDSERGTLAQNYPQTLAWGSGSPRRQACYEAL